MLKAGRGDSQRSEGSCGCRSAAGWHGGREPSLSARDTQGTARTGDTAGTRDTPGTGDGAPAPAGKRAGEVSGCRGCAGSSASPGQSCRASPQRPCRRHSCCSDFYGFLLFVEQDFGPLCALASFDLELILEMQGKGWGWRTESAACLGRGGCGGVYGGCVCVCVRAHSLRHRF